MLHGFAGMAMILQVVMAVMHPVNAIPHCLLPKVANLNQEQVVCKNIQNIKVLSEVKQREWKNLKVVNEKQESFQMDNENNGQFTGLEKLDLSQVGELVLGNNAFRDLQNLQALNVSGTQLESLEGIHFNDNNKLTDLDASWNFLKELNFDFKNTTLFLQSANFSHNAIKIIESDSGRVFQKLQRLYLDNNELKMISLHFYPVLEIVTLSDNQIDQLTSKSFSFVDSMDELILTANPLFIIEDRTFESMAKLRVLNLSANSLEQLSAEVFAGLGRLIQLDLSSNDLRVITHLQFQYLVKLQYLDISRNSLTALNSTHFNSLSNLRKLYIYENDITEVKANTFANLISLDTLDLSYNALEYIEADVFGSFTLPRLKKLILKSNNLKDLHPLAFTSLPFLQYLSLGFNELSTLDVRMIAPLRRLEKIHLGNNLLETIPSEVLDSLTDVSELLLDNNRLTFLSETNATFRNLAKVSIEGNPWQCPCFDELTQWLEDRHITYLRKQSPFYMGQKPLCVITQVNFCVKNIDIVKEHDIEDIYNKRS